MSAKITIAEREHIFKSLHQGKPQNQIAKELGRSKSTISYEIHQRGFTKSSYSPFQADSMAKEMASSRKLGKHKISNPLASLITYRLKNFHWSPEQIAGRLKRDYPESKGYHISHETIYRWIYSRKPYEKEALITSLRKRKKLRTSRKKQGKPRGAIQNGKSIHERLPEHKDRKIAGNWEGDFILGKEHQTAMGTLVDRKSKFLLLFPLGRKKTAKNFAVHLTQVFNALEPKFKKSLTYDRGSEMALHQTISQDTGVPIFFADPGSPYQRGTNENTNGLLRQYFSKGTPLDGLTYEEVRRVQDSLNQRPRKSLGYRTPEEVLGLKGFWVF